MGIADINLSWLVTKWRFIEMLWSLLSCLHEGKCASSLECCFSFVGNCKARKAQALEHSCVNDTQLHVSVRCKVIFKSEMCWTSVVVWMSREVHNSVSALCKMFATCKMLLLGFTLWYCRPLFQEKSSWGIKHFKLYVLLQMNAFSALRIIAVASDLL